MKVAQLIENDMEIFFFKNHAEDDAERQNQQLFLCFEKTLYKVKPSCQQFIFHTSLETST